VFEQSVLFPELDSDQLLNPMIRKHGTGPQGTKCTTCRHLITFQPGQYQFYRCIIRAASGDLCTDHRSNWQSCQKYEVINSGSNRGK